VSLDSRILCLSCICPVPSQPRLVWDLKFAQVDVSRRRRRQPPSCSRRPSGGRPDPMLSAAGWRVGPIAFRFRSAFGKFQRRWPAHLLSWHARQIHLRNFERAPPVVSSDASTNCLIIAARSRQSVLRIPLSLDDGAEFTLQTCLAGKDTLADFLPHFSCGTSTAYAPIKELSDAHISRTH
jgi:hypothetical protein